ncbi:MAG TPA: alpha-L-arabinofuranosidase C-terminal domain-containing protein [Vicinamibacterales bacterium]
MRSNRLTWRLLALALPAALIPTSSHDVRAQQPPTLTVRADQPGPRMDPMFYGLMTEEINFSYDGGLYAELIRNRTFRDDPSAPVHWSLVKDAGSEGAVSLDQSPVPNTALTTALKIDVSSVADKGHVGAANEGYWGIPVKPETTYRVSFWAKGSRGFGGPLTAAIETTDGATVWAKADIGRITPAWKKYSATLKTGQATRSTSNRFTVSSGSKGTFWLSLVSLFPPTYKNRPNGNRPDIMELLAAMRPKFLRFPGGNYLEGPNFENRFNWKATIGPLEQRPTHMSPWRYRSSDGMGLLEFLEWAEDLGMEPVLAVYAGLHIDRGANILTGDALQPHVEDALDEIEYVTGSPSTSWGARRAKDGHPRPFPLRYVEIGNEDWLNNGTASYDSRFTLFYDAIKAKYPAIKVISTMRTRDQDFVHTRKPDLLDDHFYVTIPTALAQAHLYDGYSRTATKVFVGEWATNNPRTGDTPMMAFALGDAAWLTGLERNADVVTMNCYAPLFVNVNPGGRQWAVNLIGYDALTSFGSPSYYVQKMFSTNRGDVVLPATIDPLPKLTLDQIPQAPQPPPTPGRAGGGRAASPPPGPFDSVYVSAMREDSTGDVILKLVNVQATAQPLRIDVKGVTTVKSSATGEVLTGDLTAVNTVADPMKVAPKPIAIRDAAFSFVHELPAHSVSVIRLKTR